MAAGDAIDIAAQAQREPRHVAVALTGMALQFRKRQEIAQDLLDHAVGELIVPCLNGRMGRKDTALAHRFRIAGYFAR